MDMWTEASRDHQAEASIRRHAQVMVRIAHLWPFLSAAEDVEAFRLRRTLADAQIDSAVGDVVGFGEEFAPLRSEVDTTLEGDFETLHAARLIERQAAALKEASAPDGTKAQCGTCGKEIQSQDYAWYHMARDFPHGEDHPAHPSPHKGASKTADFDPYPNGRCPACGNGLDDEGRCQTDNLGDDTPCSNYGRVVGPGKSDHRGDSIASRTAGHEVEVGSVPNCDLCKYEDGKDNVPAEYDARLTNHPQARGSWANVCEKHFQQYGPGQTGTGYAQRLKARATKTAGFPGDNPQERDYDDSGPQVTDQDSRVAYANYTIACMDAGTSPLPQAQWEAQGRPAGPEGSQDAQAPTPVDAVQQIQQQGSKTADFDGGDLGGTIDPAPQADATQMVTVEPEGDEWDLLSNTVAAALRIEGGTETDTCANCGDKIWRDPDVGDNRWYHAYDESPNEPEPGHEAIPVGQQQPAPQGQYLGSTGDAVPFGEGASAPHEGSITREAAAWGRRHYEDLASFISSQDDREALAKHFAQHLTGTNPAFRPEQFVAAASQPGYQVRGGTGVANYSRQHFQTLANAIKTYPGEQGQMAQALADHLSYSNPRFNRDLFLRAAQGAKTAEMVNDADHAVLEAEWQRAFQALQDAGLEADADHPIAAAYRAASNAVNHANRSRDFNIATGQPTAAKTAYYNLVNASGQVVAGPYVDAEDANAALTGRQDDNLHVEPAEEPDDSEGEFASYGSLSTEADVPVHPEESVGTGYYTHLGNDVWGIRCDHCGEVIRGQGQGGAASERAVHITRNHGTTSARISCRKCVAGKDPSGGDCDYCDAHGSLDLTLAMVKAADGWDQGITRAAFKTARDIWDERPDIEGTRASDPPFGPGANVPPPCPFCQGSGEDDTFPGERCAHCRGTGMLIHEDGSDIPAGHEMDPTWQRHAAWADTKADLSRHHGKDVRLTYNDDQGVNTVTGRLSYDGDVVRVGDKPIKAAYVLDVQPTGSGDDREWGQGSGREPGLMDRLLNRWPSGATARLAPPANGHSTSIEHTAANPIMPAPGADMTRYMEQMRDAQDQAARQTMPAQPPQPATPAAPPAPASAPSPPVPVPGATTHRPTTTRPRQQPKPTVQQGFAALIEAQDSHLQPPVPNAQAFEQKVDEIAADIQAENPQMEPAVARRLAVAAIRRYPETVASTGKA